MGVTGKVLCLKDAEKMVTANFNNQKYRDWTNDVHLVATKMYRPSQKRGQPLEQPNHTLSLRKGFSWIRGAKPRRDKKCDRDWVISSQMVRSSQVSNDKEEFRQLYCTNYCEIYSFILKQREITISQIVNFLDKWVSKVVISIRMFSISPRIFLI